MPARPIGWVAWAGRNVVTVWWSGAILATAPSLRLVTNRLPSLAATMLSGKNAEPGSTT